MCPVCWELCAPATVLAVWSGAPFGYFCLILEVAQQRQEYVVGCLVLGVHLEHGPLEILHGVGLAVGVRSSPASPSEIG